MKKDVKKLRNNTILMIIGSFSSKFLVFLLLPFYTHVLSTTEYGISDIVFTTANLLYPVFSFLMTESILRFSLDTNEHNDRKNIFSTAIYISGLGFIVLLLLSPIFWFIEIFKNYYVFFMLYYFSMLLYLLFSQFAKGINQVKEFSLAGILNTFLTICFNLIFLLIFDLGINGYLLAYILGSFLSALFLFIKLKYYNYLIPPKKVNKKNAKKMLAYSLPMIPNSISWWISNSSDKYMISYFCDVAVNGIYSASYKIPTLLTTFSSVFVNAWQLSAVDEFGSEQNRKFYKVVYEKYAALNIIIVTLLIALVKIISMFLFDQAYYTAWMPASILLLAYVFNTASGFLGTIYTSAKKTGNLFISTLLAAILNIVFNFILIKQIGMTGAAIATLISYFFVWLYRLINSKKIIDIQIELKSNIISYFLIILEIFILFYTENLIQIILLALIVSIIFLINKRIIIEIYHLIFDKLKIVLKKYLKKAIKS